MSIPSQVRRNGSIPLVVAISLVCCVGNPPLSDRPDASPERALILDSAAFDAVIVRQGTTALVEFYEALCGTCMEMSWIIDSLTVRYRDSAVVAAVDISSDRSLGERFSVGIVPSYLFFRDGEPVARRSVDQLGSNAFDTLDLLFRSILDDQSSDTSGTADTTEDTISGTVPLLTAATIDSALSGSYRLAVIDFFSPTCYYCTLLSPVFDSLELAQPEDILIAKVDIVEETALRGTYAVKSFPTVVYFKNGIEVHRTVGSNSLDFFTGVIDSLLQVP